MTGPPVPRLIALLALAAVALVMAGGTSEATGPAVVRLTDRQVSDTGATNGVPGTVEVIRVLLYGSSSKSRAIGRGVLTCTHVGGTERTCSGSYVLPRGTIETAGIVQSRLLYTQAIIGGTGLYDNARGSITVTAQQIRPRREILLFRLTG